MKAFVRPLTVLLYVVLLGCFIKPSGSDTSNKYKKTHPDSLRVEYYLNQADSAYALKDWATTLAWLDSADQILAGRKGGYDFVYSNSLYTRGRAEYERNHIVSSIDAFEKSLSIRDSLLGSEHWRLGLNYYNLALSKQNTFNAGDTVYGIYRKSIELLENSPPPNDSLIAGAYHNMAVFAYNRGAFSRALEFNLKALDLRLKRDSSDSKDLAWEYNNVGVIYSDLGQFLKARYHYEQSANMRRRLYGEHHLETAIGYNNLAAACMFAGDIRAAKEYGLKSLAIREQLDSLAPPDWAEIYINLSSIYNETGEYELAELYGKKGVEVCEQNMMTLMAYLYKAHQNLGNTYVLMERYEEGLDQFNKAQTYIGFGGAAAAPNVVDIVNNIGTLYERTGNYQAYKTQILKALDLFRGHSEHPDREARLYTNLGIAYMNLLQLDSAQWALSRALSKSNELSASGALYKKTALLSLARVKRRKKQYDEALTLLSQARSINARETDVGGNIQDQYYTMAALTVEGAIWADREDGDAIDNLKESLKWYGEACDLVDSIWSKSGMDNMTRKTYLISAYLAYEGYLQSAFALEALFKDGQYARHAWEMSERAKGHVMRDSFRKAKARSVAGVPQAILNKEYDIRIKVVQYERQHATNQASGEGGGDDALIDSLLHYRNLENDLNRLLKSEYPEYWMLARNDQVTPMDTIKAGFQKNECQLSFFVGDSSVYAFVLDRESLHMEKIKLDFPLKSWVEDMRNGLTAFFYQKTNSSVLLRQSTIQYLDAAEQLYQKLVLPVEARLTDRVTIMPDGALGYVPFDALVMERAGDPERFHAHRYFGREKQISYAYSATLQYAMEQRESNMESSVKALAMAPFYRGNPDSLYEHIAVEGLLTLKRDGLAPLPASGQEVKDVCDLVGGIPVYGTSGTRPFFLKQAKDYNVIHLSTHGQANDRVGENSWIAFASEKDSTEFDKLYLREIYNMRLNAELVTLSACETGIGPLQRGEGVISLARAFAFAGASSIAMSLWKVSDTHTATLMRDFYYNMRVEGQPKDEALWTARERYLKENKGIDAHPYFWSGFVLVGDMRRW